MKTKIKIKRFVDDESLSWEERFKKLEAHHKEETQFLINEIETLECTIEELDAAVERYWLGK